MKYQKVFIVGGAGFLGYHASLELTKRGANVTALALPYEEVDEELSTSTQVVRANIDELSDEQLSALLIGHDALVYAAGPDDRIELAPGVSATEFFQTQLVERTERVLRIAKSQGIQKAILFGSYFSYINNHGLCGVKAGSLERHPYIKARVDQTNRAFALGDESFTVATLHIPYVFGVAPGKTPIWKHVFVDRFGSSSQVVYGNGGTTIISAKKIAVCVAQSLELANNGDELAIGSVDMKFTPMIQQLFKAAHIDKPVANIPTWLLSLFMKKEWRSMRAKNLDSGLDVRYLAKDILGRDFYVDYKTTDNRLQMSDYVDDVDQAIEETGQKMDQQNSTS